MALIYKSIQLSSSGVDTKEVKVSADDTNAGYLEDKVVVGSTKLTKQTLLPGAAETLELDIDESQINHNALLNYDVNQHRDLDDTVTTLTDLWSSTKIQTELDTKINKATPVVDNTLLKTVGTSGVDVEATGIIVDDTDNVTGINNLILDGNLTVNGTTTTVNSTTLDVTDPNITVNNGGTQAAADTANAGLTIEMSDATNVEIGYDSTTTSKVTVGEVGSLSEVVTTAHTQTVLNKTIDADNNTISNLEVDNLKTGVLATDLDVAVDNTKIAGAQAIKDYVVARVAEKDEASEISYDNTTSLLAATDTQAAVDEVEGRLDTAETSLAAHLDANPSKHNATQINNAAAGNIVATTVQAAINELDTEKYVAANFNGDFDTRLGTKDSDDVAEGATNLYHTDERSQDSVGNILADTTSVDFTYDDTTPQITAVVLPAGVDHDSLANFIGNEHIDHSSVSVSGGAGLGGGGNISINRTITLDVTNLASETVIADADLIAIYDDSVSAHRKIPMSSITSANTSSGDLNETSFSLAESAAGSVVTGFAFANGTTRSFESIVSVEINATASLFEQFEISGIQKGASWDITITSVGDDSLIEFDISAAGQVTYSSSSYTGFTTGLIKFRAKTTTV